MRAAFGLLSLVVVLGIVLTLAKKQSTAQLAPPSVSASGVDGGTRTTRPEAVGQQVQDAVNAAAQRASDAQP
ncbi:MAG: hypothetical protein ACK520_03960 [Inhella sp.]|jgi:hypothetical protein|uniref:hypothetical protein n=1 Tax=Inhella sp. TaxID=1921806 RepID=UPI0022CB58E1|nr:hypothetical protein [Inhella sp.]MCZ8236496.1 hypothetical protein [Inhella sp.]